MTTRICAICEDEFDLNERIRQKRGKIIHCGDCAEETTVKYIGTSAGEGKQAAVQVLKFESEGDRAAYLSYFQNASGLHKSKSCQIGRGLKTAPAVKFKTRATFTGNVNHKGKGD